MKPATLTLLVYRVLARAFPREFRQAYGDQMLQLTEAIVDDVWRREGVRGLLRLLADIASGYLSNTLRNFGRTSHTAGEL